MHLENSSAEILFKLLRIALGRETDYSLPEKIDWSEVVDLSFKQGVAAIAVDGLQKLYDAVPDLELAIDSPELEGVKYEWFGEVMNCEDEYSRRNNATNRLAGLWSSAGLSTVILKGSSFAQYYPVPGHRYSCDLDLFIGENWQTGCSILEKKGFDICYEVYKDAQFHIDNVYVECHRYIMPVRGNKTLQKFERYLRSLLDDGKVLLHDGNSLFVPPLMFNALFCVEHARGHLLHERIALRQVCDWVILRRQQIDWLEFWSRCDEFGLSRFAKAFDRLADLLEGKITFADLSTVEKRVANEMFASLSSEDAKPLSFLKRRIRLFFETLHSGWKYKAFNDVSMPVALFRQVWTHFFHRKQVL